MQRLVRNLRCRLRGGLDAAGKVRWDALSDEEFKAFHGILGHYHVTKDKQDPGPAFDWEPFLERVRARIAELGVKP